MTGTTCSVVICTRDRPDYLRRCLESIASLDRRPDTTIVVDSAPSHSVRDIAAAYGAQYLHTTQPGLSHARNIGALAATTDIVTFIDDDATAEHGWLGELEREFVDPQVGVVTGACLPEAGDVPDVVREATRVWWRADAEREVIDRSVNGWAERALGGGLGTGSCMAFRRNLWSDWSGFDERLGRGVGIPGGEEHEAFYALLHRGYRLVYTPRAIIRHRVLSSDSQLRVFVRDTRATYVAFLLHMAARHASARPAIARVLLNRLVPRRIPRARVAGDRSRERGVVPRARLLDWLGSAAAGTAMFIRSRAQR
jgi:glycosyltransferase involved in cell wall biosynthesis